MTKKKPQKPGQPKQQDAYKQDPGRKSGPAGRSTQKRGGQGSKPQPEDPGRKSASGGRSTEKRGGERVKPQPEDPRKRPGPEEEEGRPWEPVREQP